MVTIETLEEIVGDVYILLLFLWVASEKNSPLIVEDWEEELFEFSEEHNIMSVFED